MFCGHAAIVKPKAGPSGKVYTEEDWNTEVDENAQGPDAYRYSKVLHIYNLLHTDVSSNTIMQLLLPDICARLGQHNNVRIPLNANMTSICNHNFGLRSGTRTRL